MTTDPTDELIRLSHGLVQAIGKKDAQALAAILDDDFVHFSSDRQRQTKQQFLSAIREAEYTIDALGFDWLQGESNGAVGVVVGIQRARGHLPNGEEFLSVGAFTDVFRRTDGGWRLWLAHSVELPE